MISIVLESKPCNVLIYFVHRAQSKFALLLYRMGIRKRRRYACIHSFIPDIYIALLKETYSEALSVHQRPKRNVLRTLQKEDTLFRGSKRSVRGSLFQVEGPITESSTLFKRRAGPRNQELTTSRRTNFVERRVRREARSETGLQRSVR